MKVLTVFVSDSEASFKLLGAYLAYSFDDGFANENLISLLGLEFRSSIVCHSIPVNSNTKGDARSLSDRTVSKC